MARGDRSDAVADRRHKDGGGRARRRRQARKYRGDALPRTGRQTLAGAYDEWWRLRASTLAKTTQASYRAVWNAHIRDGFDGHRLDELAADPQLIDEFVAQMRADGVGAGAQRKTLAVLSAVLGACVEWRKIASNPVAHVRKPPAGRQRLARPFPPLVVEQIRRRMLDRPQDGPDDLRPLRDALLVSILAYAGLRPGEALALTFGDVGERSIGVDKAIAAGEEKETKTRATRIVPLSFHVRMDVVEYRTRRGWPGEREPIFPGVNGGPWSESMFRNWRRRVWKPVLDGLAGSDPALGHLRTARPYDCRGSFVSLHLRAGSTPLEVASWSGHSPQVMFRHYAGVIEELVGEPPLPADEQISRARQAVAAVADEEVTEMVVDLFERPTQAAAGGAGAWRRFYAPHEGP